MIPIWQNIRLWGILGSRLEFFRCIRVPHPGKDMVEYLAIAAACGIIRDAIGVQLESSGSRAMDGLRGLRWRR
ncbi:MAG: hypothetical protein Ct9H90mP24_2100 [Methanobacteriota archaeon]|nr:MAG: hypothetical protein Ct9H90mP24_2100 [Euryarchaeota archaeon]